MHFALVCLIVIVIGLCLMYADHRATFCKRNPKNRKVNYETTHIDGQEASKNPVLPREAK
jgi:hypothetical protein